MTRVATALRAEANRVRDEAPALVGWNGPPGDLAQRCAELAGSRGPLRRALASVAARFVATQGWERLGFARLGDYARERLGLSASSIRDLARVDAKLRELPRIEVALLDGRLTWTRVRLLARVATPSDEGDWIAHAERVTARHLSREVRAVDSGSLEAGAAPCDEDGLEETEREGVRLRCAPEVRARWFYARQLAQRVAGERLTPGAVLESLTGEVLSALPIDSELAGCDEQGSSWAERLAADTVGARSVEPLRSEGIRPHHDTDRQTGDGPRGSARRHLAIVAREEGPSAATLPRSGLPAFLRPWVAGVEAADPFELDRRLRALASFEQRIDQQIGGLLARVAAGRTYRWLGFANMEAFAREKLGISPRKARALLRLERAGQLCPDLNAAYGSGRLSWVQAQTLVPLLILSDTVRWRRDWIEWAGRVTVRRLEDDVERALLIRETDPETWSASGGLPDGGATDRATQARRRQTGDEPRAAGSDALLWIVAPREVARLFRALLCTVRRRIEHRSGGSASESDGFSVILEHAIETWGGANPRMRREWRVFERDGWRCTAPGCSSLRNLHDHHIRFRAAGGSDALSNRTTLCAWHHLRGVHAGVVGCTGEAPDSLRFELGRRRGAPPLARYRSGDLCC